MSTILVTGRNGFIANALVNSLKKDHKIISLVRSQKTHLDYANEELFIADLSSLPLEQLLAYKIDMIIHAAAMIKGHPEVVEKHNIETAKNIFHVAERLGVPVIFFSSVNALFADNLGGYARSKRAAEEMLTASRLRYLILRVPLVLGEDSLTVKNIRNFTAKAPIFPLFGSMRGKTHVISLEAIIRFLKSRISQGNIGQEAVNLLSRETYTYPQIVTRLTKRDVRFLTFPYQICLKLAQGGETLKLKPLITSEQIKSFNIDKVITGNSDGKTVFVDEDPKILFG